MLEDQKCGWAGKITYKTLPKIGYIVMLGNAPVAAGFLRKLEGGYGQLDTFVTNPFLGSIVRNEGLNQVVENLLLEAKNEKMLGLLAMTESPDIIKRAKDNYNFQIMNQTILGLTLTT